MKYILLFLLIINVAHGQEKRTVIVPPSKDTTVVEFTASTVTSSQTSVTYTTRTIPVKSDSVVIPSPSGYVLTFQSGYDTRADMLYGGNGQYGNGTISTTFYKTGPGSFLSHPANVSNGIRSEVQYTEASQNPEEGRVQWDVYYEVIVPNDGCSVQWHPETPGSSGAPYLMHDGGKFTWVNWKGGGNTYYPTNVAIPSKKWVTMAVEYKFGTNGYWRHYMDGKLIGSWIGQVGDNSGHYIKVGWNSWGSTGATSRIYYDNLKIYKKI